VNAKELRLAAKAVRGRIEKNLSLISEKSSQLATKIHLEPVTEDLEVVQDLIKDENQTRRNHNDALNNLDRTKTRLREEAWHLLFDRGIGVACEEHIETVEPIKKALKGLESSIKEHMNQVAKLKLEINELEEKRTSVAPTANWINKMLAAAGFDNFTLAIQDLNKYRIVRAGGDDALETLSEGERSLITFLYFYNLASGSTKTEGTTEKRVLVIDDPVSSLDSHTLFLVSTLVRQLIEKARAAEDKISQVILLTHNIKFHHEVSFGANRKGWDSDLAYWTVRKRGHVSEIEPHNSNPVRSSYEMTWQEALQSASAVQKVTVRNAMRRILETYFGMVGEQTFEDLLPECNPEEMIVVRSLLSWIHAGSHVIDDDLYSTTDPSTVETYREVFRRIFKESGHSAHYDLMVERLQLDASNGEKVSS
jgi:wobble nucleotide-excising tRNase